MNKNKHGAAQAMAGIAGIAAIGAAAAYMMNSNRSGMKTQRKVLKKNASKAVRMVGEVASDVYNMMR